MNHMSQILTSSGSSSSQVATSEIFPRPSRMPLTTTTIMAKPEKFMQLETCPAHCGCACPMNEIMETGETKRVDLDLTLIPCARKALRQTYQLDLALRLCKK